MVGTILEPQKQNVQAYCTQDSLRSYARLHDLFPIEKKCLQRYFPKPPARVLDLGCGTGRTTEHLCRLNYDVVAVDITAAMIEYARNKIPGADFRVMDATCLDLRSESFDAVWFSFNGLDSIYPLQKRTAAIKEIRRVLKPGGIFLFSAHNIVGRYTRFFRPICKCFKYHAEFFLQSLGKPLMQNYWREKHYSDGWLTMYCGIPLRQLMILRKLNFEVVAVESSYAEGLWNITLKDFWPHYVARKPADIEERTTT